MRSMKLLVIAGAMALGALAGCTTEDTTKCKPCTPYDACPSGQQCSQGFCLAPGDPVDICKPVDAGTPTTGTDSGSTSAGSTGSTTASSTAGSTGGSTAGSTAGSTSGSTAAGSTSGSTGSTGSGSSSGSVSGSTGSSGTTQ